MHRARYVWLCGKLKLTVAFCDRITVTTVWRRERRFEKTNVPTTISQHDITIVVEWHAQIPLMRSVRCYNGTFKAIQLHNACNDSIHNADMYHSEVQTINKNTIRGSPILLHFHHYPGYSLLPRMQPQVLLQAQLQGLAPSPPHSALQHGLRD